MTAPRRAFTLIELLIVIGLMALLISILLPTLSKVRTSAKKAMLASEARQAELDRAEMPNQPASQQAAPHANVKSFEAQIGLTPQLSVGTATPESIYTATFKATITASAEAKQGADHEIALPLPPQIISLGDLSVAVDGQPSEALSLRGDKLVWRGTMAGETPVKFDVSYTAVGKGLYSLQMPPAGILDTFKIDLAANGSDVRMLELSLQPTSLKRSASATQYVWDYKRLIFARPIALDVLGIAPVDRLGELYWLGPVSVVAFGIVMGLVAKAYNAANIDRWMLVLVVGLFTGAYPLMYFAQEYMPLLHATVAMGAAVLIVIMIRMITLVGFNLGVFGVTIPAAAIMALALVATTRPNLQGILLTGLGLGLFVLGMMLSPRLHTVAVAQPVTV